MITGMIAMWLLLGLLAAILIREHDGGSISLLAVLVLVTFGGISLIVYFIELLADTEI